MNPMQLIQMIMSSSNPQQKMLSILEQQAQGNPLYANLINLAKNNDASGIERVARNLLKERGLDFDKEFAAFKKTLRL